jgi:hypothetical protein
MLDCKQASQLISQSLDSPLTLRERIALQLHLIICKYCKKFSQHLQSMRLAIKKMTTSIENDDKIEIPAAAKNRITSLINAGLPSNQQQP